MKKRSLRAMTMALSMTVLLSSAVWAADMPPGGFGGGPMYTPKPATTWWGFSKDAMYPGDQPTPPTPYDTLPDTVEI